MGFSKDKQTIDELNLLGKFRAGSVYGIFNKVRTPGGERLLEQMFSHPLEEVEAINQRTAVFRYFQEAGLSFPFDAREVAEMSEYLDGGSSAYRWLSMVELLKTRLLAMVVRDHRWQKLVRGLQATMTTLNKCTAFLASMPAKGGAFGVRAGEVRALLADPRLASLWKVDIYKALPLTKLALYDFLLRSVLREEMGRVLRFVHEVDVYISVSEVARKKKFGYAVAIGGPANLLHAEGLYHPSIGGAVGNDLRMDGTRNVLFLTGANMAGKSTLMKSIGIAFYLAHMGFPVAAARMEFSVMGGLYSSINVSDNIHLGYSHFYAEVVRVKQGAEAVASGRRMLLMFDELFKGTNVRDAYDGTLAVTEGFAGYEDCLFIVSTHIIEVGEALQAYPNIQFVFMPTIMEGARPRYTYRLQEGITEDRQGMLIIRNEGILEMLGG